ncbi:unnamed protein product [Adineta steineri]|uniref:G-protein coupled receptors family 1 profile domain-containing protein n=1 Tax=Adineta steineri TaxID=433720 RepID=A0A813U580_9BILA|nr:unnamed protein product [Adineta steineri]
MSLLHIAQNFTVYGGLVLLVAGVVGNTISIYIFSSVGTYRTVPCGFYFMVESIFNILYILINLTSRIVSVGFGYDLTATSVVWCKARNFFIATLGLVTFTCSCLATIDQFFATSRSVSLRQCSNLKWAHRIVLIAIIVWCLHGIPFLIFYDIIPTSKSCGSTSKTLTTYVPIFVCVLLCGIPISFMIIFGFLTYRNIQHIRALAEQRADRQFTQMCLIKVVLIIITNTPFGSYTAYSLITSGMTKDLNRQMQEYLAASILSVLNYTYYVGSFYMFLISSKRFRQTVKSRIFCWHRLNQIDPSATFT